MCGFGTAQPPGTAQPSQAGSGVPRFLLHEIRGFGTAERAAEAEGGETGGEGEQEGDRDAGQEQQAEAPDHRGRGELQSKEAGGGRDAGGGDRRAAFGRSRAGRLVDPRLRRQGAALGVRPRGLNRRDLLVEACLELDRVVDGEADRDRQDGDRRHRQDAAEEPEQAEDDCRRRQCQGQREQAQTGAEDGQQSQRHRRQRHPEEHQQGVLQRPFEAVDHDRGAGDDVAATLQLETGSGLAFLGAGLARGRVGDRGLDQLDRPVPIGGTQARLQPHHDLGRAAVREEVGEP